MVQIGSLLLSILFIVNSAMAGITVKATVDPKEASIGDSVVLTVTVNSDNTVQLNDPTLPDLNGFQFLRQSQSQQRRSVMVNGEFQYLQTFNFIYELAPTKNGTLEIGPVEVVVNGEVYKTQKVSIKVSDDASRAQPHPRPQQQLANEDDDLDPMLKRMQEQLEKMDEDFSQLLRRPNRPQADNPIRANPDEAFFVHLEVDKKEAYVGEQVTATWYLYTKNAIQNMDSLKYPNLKDFIREDIEVATRLNFESEVVNGVPYKRAKLLSYALFPMKEGTALIDSYKLKCTVLIGSLGGFGFGRSYTFTKASREEKIRVKPLPTTNRPQDFSGGVGQFGLSAKADTKSLHTHQPFSFKIRVQGRGNAKIIELPPLDLPQSLELYSKRDETVFNKDGSSYKEFELLLIPRQEGKLQIPPISMSFFEPEKAVYYTQSTMALEFNVAPGKSNGVMANVDTPNIGESKTVRIKQLPPPIMEFNTGHSTQVDTFVLVGGFLASLMLLGFRAKRSFGWGEKKRNLQLIIKQRFKKIYQYINEKNWRAVGAEGTNVLYYVLGELSGESGSSSDRLDVVIDRLPPSVRRELESEIRDTLREFETLSFAPEDLVGSKKEKKNLNVAVKNLEKLLLKAIRLDDSEEKSA